jgi:hypothetical protein
MAQSFFHQDFLRNIDLELFNQYLMSKSLLPLETTDDVELVVESMVEYVDNFSQSDKDVILSDFISAKELA